MDITWLEAEAADMPLADAAFDAATSCFGIMFAPDPVAAAAELARVLRPGARVALVGWCPRDEGEDPVSGPLMRRFPQPAGPAPTDWGVEEIVRPRLDIAGFGAVTAEPRDFTWRFDDVDQAVTFFLERSSVHAALLATLPETEQTAIRGEMLAAVTADNGADQGVEIVNRWLLVTARRAGSGV